MAKAILKPESHMEIVLASQEQLVELNELLEIVRLPEGEIDKWLKKANVESLAEMSSDKLKACIMMLRGKIAGMRELERQFEAKASELRRYQLAKK